MTEFNLLITLVAFMMGGISFHYAKQRGRNRFGWFFIGFLFGILGLIALFLLPNRNNESLSKELASKANTQKDTEPEKIAPPIPSKFWYYLDPVNQQFGPMSYDALQEAWKDGKITLTTYVWNEDLADWIPFGKIETHPS